MSETEESKQLVKDISALATDGFTAGSLNGADASAMYTFAGPEYYCGGQILTLKRTKYYNVHGDMVVDYQRRYCRSGSWICKFRWSQ